MKKSLLLIIIAAGAISTTVHAMDPDQNRISPDKFNIDSMIYILGELQSVGQMGRTEKTGAFLIVDQITPSKESMIALIKSEKEQTLLKKLLHCIQQDPINSVVDTVMEEWETNYCYDTSDLIHRISRLFMRSMSFNVLLKEFPDIKLPEKNLTKFFTLLGPESAEIAADFLKMNADIDAESNKEAFYQMILLFGYFTQEPQASE